MYTENTNRSVYESIARAILVSGNNRVLTFHAYVNTERDTSVINFVKESEFICTFMKVLSEEFPEKAGLYTTFKMIALDASIPMKNRRAILDEFDTTLDDGIYVISSCETISEGIDTKNANMCVFVDPGLCDLIYCVDNDNKDANKFRYSQDQRRKETKKKKYLYR